jgi:hypothetical protein
MPPKLFWPFHLGKNTYLSLQPESWSENEQTALAIAAMKGTDRCKGKH